MRTAVQAEVCTFISEHAHLLDKEGRQRLVRHGFLAEREVTKSVIATIRNRTWKTKGCLNPKTALAMVFGLMMSARKKWRKSSGPNRLPEAIQGGEFKDGIKQLQNAA